MPPIKEYEFRHRTEKFGIVLKAYSEEEARKRLRKVVYKPKEFMLVSYDNK
jgi:hypothetical protein